MNENYINEMISREEQEKEDAIIEAFRNSDKSWDAFVDKFSGDIYLSKDSYVEWLERLTIEDVPKKFIKGVSLLIKGKYLMEG